MVFELISLTLAAANLALLARAAGRFTDMKVHIDKAHRDTDVMVKDVKERCTRFDEEFKKVKTFTKSHREALAKQTQILYRIEDEVQATMKAADGIMVQNAVLARKMDEANGCAPTESEERTDRTEETKKAVQ